MKNNKMKFQRGRLALAAGCLAMVFAFGVAAGSQKPPLTITLAGESMIRSDIRVHSPGAVAAIKPLLKGDVVFTNFEGTVLGKGQSPSTGNDTFPSSPGAIAALKTLGFNLLALSDNHAFDLGVRGIRSTLRTVDSLHIVHAGTGENLAEASAPAYLHTPQGTVALISMASGLIPPGGMATATQPGINQLRVEAGGKMNNANTFLPAEPGNQPYPPDKERILNSIREARRHADLVIVYQHNHVYRNIPFLTIFDEELPQRLVPPEWIRKWTHEEIDAGADIVVMHGAPLVQGIEIYHGHPIFYDLGNFIFQMPPTNTRMDEAMIWEGVIAHLAYQGRKLESVTFQPIALNKLGQGEPDVHNPHDINLFLKTRGIPRPATGIQAHFILERLAGMCRPFGTTIEVSGDEAKIRLHSGD
ncbi:MAG TPA: CapA family protein [Candidatus Dormibacteraeota bacterium]|nr:CapA family protein [Candidatus Dormibacteraeota bacterium]